MAKRKAADSARKSAPAAKGKSASAARNGDSARKTAKPAPRAEKPPSRRRRAAPPTLIPPAVLGGPAVLKAALETPSSSLVVQQEPEATPGGYIDRGQPIPENYGYDRLVALVRDPNWIFSYWELHGPKLPSIREDRGQQFIDDCAWVLRLYRISEGVAVDMEIDPSIGNWYICVGAPGKYQLELALLSPDGEWITLLVSQIVETPRSSPSDVIDDEWRMRPEDEEALASLLRRQSALADAAGRGTSGFLGASRLLSSFALASSSSRSTSASRRRCSVESRRWSLLSALLLLRYSHLPTVFPSSNFAATKLPAAEPSRIGWTRIVTLVPALKVDGRMPWRDNWFGLPHSMLHSFGASPGLVSATTWIQECGLVNWNSLMVPVSSVVLFSSNIVPA